MGHTGEHERGGRAGERVAASGGKQRVQMTIAHSPTTSTSLCTGGTVVVAAAAVARRGPQTALTAPASSPSGTRRPGGVGRVRAVTQDGCPNLGHTSLLSAPSPPGCGAQPATRSRRRRGARARAHCSVRRRSDLRQRRSDLVRRRPSYSCRILRTRILVWP
eukprot:COSAG01_NODE_5161_length_4439_cov_6.008291_2_plen_162_part_00